MHQVEAQGHIALVGVSVATGFKLLENLFGTGAVAVKGKGYSHERELFIALG